MVSDMEVHMKQRCVSELFHAEKLLPLIFIDVERLWRPNSGCEHSVAEDGDFQQW